MKAMKFMVFLVLALTGFAVKGEKLTAEMIWVEGTSWTHMSKKEKQDGITYEYTECRLGQPTIFNGLEYVRLFTDDNALDMWVRAEDDQVFLYIGSEKEPYDASKETRLYDFRNWSESWKTTLVDWVNVDNPYYNENSLDYYEGMHIPTFGYEHEVYLYYKELMDPPYPGAPDVWLYTGSSCRDLWINGIGKVTGTSLLASFCQDPFPMYITWTGVSELRDPQGRVIYRYNPDYRPNIPAYEDWPGGTLPNPWGDEEEPGDDDDDSGEPSGDIGIGNTELGNGNSGVEEASVASELEPAPYFDLFGRVVTNPQSNTLYIHNGQKVLIP